MNKSRIRIMQKRYIFIEKYVVLSMMNIIILCKRQYWLSTTTWKVSISIYAGSNNIIIVYTYYFHTIIWEIVASLMVWDKTYKFMCCDNNCRWQRNWECIKNVNAFHIYNILWHVITLYHGLMLQCNQSVLVKSSNILY